MTVPSNLFVMAFRQQRLGLMFTVIMAIMVYLATLAMSAQASLSSVATAWGHSREGRLTIEIPPPDEKANVAQSERVRQVIAALRAMPEVGMVESGSDAETARLLKPWINDAALLRSLPLPALIDVKAASGWTLEAETLRKTLAGTIENVRVDDHADWMAALLRLLRGLSLIAGLTILLAGLTMVIAISLICRTAMAVQHETIELLHLMGATDADIARQFQHHARRLSFPAALAGFGLAAVTFAVLALLLGHFVEHPLLSLGGSWLRLILMSLSVPLIAVAGAMITARFSVLSLLRRLP